MTTPICGRCSAAMPADTAYVCTACATTARSAFELAATLAGELDTAITRQAVTGAGTARAGTEARLPYDAAAALVHETVTNTAATWARHIEDERGTAVPAPRPPLRILRTHRCTSIAKGKECKHRRGAHNPRFAHVLHYPTDTALAATWRYLAENVEWLRHQPIAAEALDELTYAAGILRRAIDRHGERVYLGQCGSDTPEGPCPHDLYAPTEAHTHTCSTCNSVWDVPERRTWLLRQMHDVLAPASDIAKLLSTFLARRVPEGTVWSWASRGRLTPRGRTRDGAPTYRIGDALNLALATTKKQVKAALAGWIDTHLICVQG